MKCRDCNCCHEVPLTRWSSVNKCYTTKYVHECWGVKEPFVIEDISVECTEYPERRNKVTEDVSIEKAIGHFKYGISHDIFKEPVTSYAKMAVEAIDKQIPKIVACDGDDESDYVYCPCCNEIIGSNEFVWGYFYDRDWKPIHCQECGQVVI